VEGEEASQVAVPSSTVDWFDMDDVADLEKDSLPEFFTGVYPSKTPATYKEYRNFMVALYRMNPQTYLTGTSCRRHLSGDACAILRIHAFLEKHGLINFSIKSDLKPHRLSLVRETTYNKVLINA